MFTSLDEAAISIDAEQDDAMGGVLRDGVLVLATVGTIILLLSRSSVKGP